MIIQAPEAFQFDTIDDVVRDIAAGKIVIVTDDADRENEGDLVMAAEKATPKAINFMAMHGRGLICVPISKRTRRPARLAADGGAKPGDVSDGFHGLGRCGEGSNDRHQRTIGRRPFAPSRARNRGLTILFNLVTSFPCGQRRVACYGAPVTLKQRLISRGWRACNRQACSAKSYTMTAQWPDSLS